MTSDRQDFLDVIVQVASAEAAVELLSRFDVDCGCRPRLWPQPHGRKAIAGVVDEHTLAALRDAGYAIEVVGSASKRWQRAHALIVRHADADRPAVPRGVGRYGKDLARES